MKKLEILNEESITSPAHLFIAIYLCLIKVDPTSRANAAPVTLTVKKEYRELLLIDNAKEITQKLLKSINNQIETRVIIGRMFGILLEIDLLFQLIHPRRIIVSDKLLPKWLRQARNNRTMTGYYAELNQNCLIPKGPLLRLPREENQACADWLPDLCSYISVAPLLTSEASREITVSVNIISSDRFFGASTPVEIGAENIIFIPIAEEIGDLELKVSAAAVGGVNFFDTLLAPHVIIPERVLNVLKREPDSDVLFAPELVISEKNSIPLSEMLKVAGKGLTKFFLAGSGASDELDDNGMAWNEARVLNGFGETMWTQKKIWPAGLQPRHFLQYGLGDTNQPLHLEKNASGDSFIVADVEGFGRCIILICQDIHAMPLSFDVISQYQPDWVFVPILDQGINYDGWAHQRIFELSALSQARFLVSCSRALNPRGDASTLGNGLAVGPKSCIEPEEISRACKLVKFQSTELSAFGKMNWKKCEWNQTKFMSV